MSVPISPDGIEEEMGLTPQRFIEWAGGNGLDGPSLLAVEVVEWLKAARGLDLGDSPGSRPRAIDIARRL